MISVIKTKDITTLINILKTASPILTCRMVHVDVCERIYIYLNLNKVRDLTYEIF